MATPFHDTKWDGVFEQKMALGHVTLQVISENGGELTEILRRKGYGVTQWHGQGAHGTRIISLILSKKKEYGNVMAAIQEIDAKAFIISDEPIYMVGGFIAKKLASGRPQWDVVPAF